MSSPEPSKEVVTADRATHGVKLPRLVLEATLAGQDVFLTGTDTKVYDYYPPYEHLSHVFVNKNAMVREGKPTWFFASEGLAKALREARFPIETGYPTETDITVYSLLQSNTIDKEWPKVAYEA
jgi:hypothetical protein